MDRSTLQRGVLIIFGVILAAQSCYGNADCDHVKKELKPCYEYMHYGKPYPPPPKCCEELKEEVKHFDHDYKEYEYFYCCVKGIYESFYPDKKVPPPPPEKRFEDLLKDCGVYSPYKISGPPYPKCQYEY